MTETLTGAQITVRLLERQGIRIVTGYPGGAILPIYDELFQQSEVEHFLVRHEQGAGHAAEGYARSTGKPGVVLVTSGPGATNMVTPLMDAAAKMHSGRVPDVCLRSRNYFRDVYDHLTRINTSLDGIRDTIDIKFSEHYQFAKGLLAWRGTMRYDINIHLSGRSSETYGPILALKNS